MPIFWPNLVRRSEHLDTLQQRRTFVYERIDEQKFGWKVVIVAGAGFLTDAYDIFAVNTVLPMLKIVYWGNDLSTSQETAINLATLIGTILGQVGFGILADRYGRKKMYGFELLIVIVATVGLALCSKGAEGSINILAWVISWRLLMGIGIGADYPLSAVIVSEFSPRRHRARMLATVFYMQPIGQLLANAVTIIATALSHRYIYKDADPSNCVGDCMEATDAIWRWIVGLGAVIPTITLLARLFIPESPRYLLEIEKDSQTARADAQMYFQFDPFEDPDQDDESLRPGGGDSGMGVIDHPIIPMEESHQRGVQDNSIDRAPPTDPDAIEIHREAPALLRPMDLSLGEAALEGEYATSSRGSHLSKNYFVVDVNSVLSSRKHSAQRDASEEHYQHKPSQETSGGHTDNHNNAPGAAEPSQDSIATRKASWREFWTGFHEYLFGVEIPEVPGSDSPHADHNNSEKRRRHRTPGNWTDLAGTSVTWFLLDFSYYFLGVNSWKVIAQIWDTPSYTSVYDLIMQFSWRALVSVSVSSMIGGALFIALARYRHNLQTYGFLILAVFFIAVGATFVTLLGTRYFAAIIVLYFFTQLFFDFGPNTSTYIIPAEVFPTQYRASCHGISAASGKLGSIVGQIIAQVYLNGNRSKRLGYALMLFSVFMVIGAGVTKYWVPDPCDIYGISRSLEDLSEGKVVRKKMEDDEKIELRAAEQSRYGLV